MSSNDRANDKVIENVKKTSFSYVTAWGRSSFPPMVLATLITALHARPFRPLPMIFPPVLLLSAYLNVASYEVDSAGITAAWSGLYLLLAQRRRTEGRGIAGRMRNRFSARGFVRGSAMAVAGVNLVACGATYFFTKREVEKKLTVEDL